jgi:guanosine-3',5'-bis(diphosphate) 3'-pyrophosphohydrolase
VPEKAKTSVKSQAGPREAGDSPTPVQPAHSELLSEPRPEARGVKGVLLRLRPTGGPPPIPREILDIVRLVRAHHPKAETRGIVRAYEIAHLVHEGQYRKSGEAFIEHPIGVARILAEHGMDTTTIVAAFLHDSIEDTTLELQELRTIFGDEVADIIDGLTKIEKIRFRTKEQERAVNLRKMIVAMARDMRVLIIKLADRLHNMRTLQPLSKAKQELVAKETLEIYAPLANRLGMQQIRAELEDLAFQTLHPKVYAEIEQMVLMRQPAREEYLKAVVSEVTAKMREVRVKAQVTGRPKHYYSIYEKMAGRGREFDEIFDLVGVRILVEDMKDCYAAVGAIHALWKPIPGRFKDYIAMPKFNLYQSLHTTVVGPEGKPLEIQIRTTQMHRTAEKGVASHWTYKEASNNRRNEEQAAWMKRMLELQDNEDDAEFLDTLRLDLFVDEVFVFTPKGEVVEMPKGATPIDFAYAIHTEVGHRCTGARVDGRLVPLSHQLTSGETVEIMTSKTGTPSRDWIDIVATPRARTKIKQWFTQQRREEAVAEGKDFLMKALRRAGLPAQKMVADGSLEALALDMKCSNLEALYVGIGEGRISTTTVVQRYVRENVIETPEEDPAPPPVKTRRPPPSANGVSVEGVDEVLVKLARCCMPVPQDPIMGFVTRGRGVSVHRTDCPNAVHLMDDGGRLVNVSWDPDASGAFPVSMLVESIDRPKLLRDVATVISDCGLNITSASSSVGNGLAVLRFTFDIANPAQLNGVISMVRKVEAVYDAYRVTPRVR